MNQSIPDETLEQVRTIIRNIAASNGISEEEVRREMIEAMREGMANPDPEVQAKWKSVPWQNREPTPEEFILWNAAEIWKERRHEN